MSFLQALQEKAASALNASPVGGYLNRPTSPDGAGQSSANHAAAQGGRKSHALEAIQYQLRALGQQYSDTSPVQKIITTEKGVAIDFDSVSRDAKALSKELYTWGQGEDEDVKDVSDRLAFLNYVQGSLSNSLAVKLDAARAPFKALRDQQTALTPRRNMRSGLHTQISRIEHDQGKGMERRVTELKEQLAKAVHEDEGAEKEFELMKRKGLRESEKLKWDAIREYGEKLVLLSQAAVPMIDALPTLPPTASQPYTGADTTASARASLQHALDNYKTGLVQFPPAGASNLDRSKSRSFGETHASELASINSSDATSVHVSSLPVTPPPREPATLPASSTSSHGISPGGPPVPIDPSALNLSPAPIPIHAPSQSATHEIDGSTPTPLSGPTIAETGVPVSAGADGPGPASGSLRDIHAASPTAGPRSGSMYGQEPGSSFGALAQSASGVGSLGLLSPGAKQTPFASQGTPSSTAPAVSEAGAAAAGVSKYETAEEEKQRLQKEERERILGAAGKDLNYPAPEGPPPASVTAGAPAPAQAAPGSFTDPVASSGAPAAAKYETAEEEKKRMEREERERILRSESRDDGTGAGEQVRKDGEELPPYQDY